MSQPVREKLAAGESLTDDEVQYARDRGIELPEEYGPGPTAFVSDPSRPDNPVAMTGSGVGLVPMPTVNEEPPDLDDMSKGDLKSLAEERGIDVPSRANRSEIIDLIVGSDSEEEELADGEPEG